MTRIVATATLVLVVACGGRPSTPTSPTREPPILAIPAYDRGEWPTWVDADGDCQDTRAEVLIAESLNPVTFADARHCRVVSGRWQDAYTGLEYITAAEVEIDHLVPLEEAHTAGGWAWDRSYKTAFANNLADPSHLVAVAVGVNRSKGSRTPLEWRPPSRAAWCWYARAWVAVKEQWELRIAPDEAQALLEMRYRC